MPSWWGTPHFPEPEEGGGDRKKGKSRVSTWFCSFTSALTEACPESLALVSKRPVSIFFVSDTC